MFRRKRAPRDPEERFRMKLNEEISMDTGAMVKIERVACGSMDCKVEYVPACNIDLRTLGSYISDWLGAGVYFLRFVDDEFEPLDELGSMWVCISSEEAEDELGKRNLRATLKLLEAAVEYRLENSLSPLRSLVELINLVKR